MLYNPMCIDVIISNSANGFQNMSTFFAGLWKGQREKSNLSFSVYLIIICKSLSSNIVTFYLSNIRTV